MDRRSHRYALRWVFTGCNRKRNKGVKKLFSFSTAEKDFPVSLLRYTSEHEKSPEFREKFVLQDVNKHVNKLVNEYAG